MSFQKGTFNTISQNDIRVGGDFPVWSRVDKLYQGGGTIDHEKYTEGTVIGAGTMVIFNGAGNQVDVIIPTAYSASSAYEVGDIVLQNNKIYKNKTAITEGEGFTSSKWTDITSAINGLVFEDVCIPSGCILATCAVVRAGRIYADRVRGGSLPTSIEANLPMIEFVRES